MGTPPNSLNCLVGAFFLAFAADGEAMRVPNPAAGTITKTFIGAISIVQPARLRRISPIRKGASVSNRPELSGAPAQSPVPPTFTFAIRDDFRYLPVVTAHD